MNIEALEPRLRRFCEMYRDFSPGHLERLGDYYADGFEFHDPFGSIPGDFTRLKKHFGKIFTSVHASKFLVDDAAVGGDGAYVRWTWDWTFKKGQARRLTPGVTHLRFVGGSGPSAEKVAYHRDLFDGTELYEVVPVLGAILRAARKRAGS